MHDSGSAGYTSDVTARISRSISCRIESLVVPNVMGVFPLPQIRPPLGEHGRWVVQSGDHRRWIAPPPQRIRVLFASCMESGCDCIKDAGRLHLAARISQHGDSTNSKRRRREAHRTPSFQGAWNVAAPGSGFSRKAGPGPSHDGQDFPQARRSPHACSNADVLHARREGRSGAF